MIALTAITNSSLKVMDTAITNSSQVAVVVVHHKVAVHHKAHTASKGSRSKQCPKVFANLQRECGKKGNLTGPLQSRRG